MKSKEQCRWGTIVIIATDRDAEMLSYRWHIGRRILIACTYKVTILESIIDETLYIQKKKISCRLSLILYIFGTVLGSIKRLHPPVGSLDAWLKVYC